MGLTHCVSSGLSVLVCSQVESQVMGEVQCWTAQLHLRCKRGCTHVCVALLWAQGGWAIETIQQGECPKITASNLVLLKSVMRLLALVVARDFWMDTNGNGMWVHPNMQWECVHDFSQGSL